MTAIAAAGRPWIARRWRWFLPAAVTIAVSLSIAFIGMAGARRTQSAYPRFLEQASASTLSIGLVPYDAAIDAAIAGLPEVRSSRTAVGFSAYPLVDGRPDTGGISPESTGTFDGRFFDIDRFEPTSGRMADPTASDEVVVNEFAASRLGYQVGQQIDLAVYSIGQQLDPSFVTDPPPPAARFSVTLVGIGLFTDEVIQDDADRTTRMLLTPALSDAMPALATYATQALVLEHGDADVASFLDGLASVVPLDATDIRYASVDTGNALTATRPLSLVVGAFGAIALVVGILLSGQALGRAVRRTQPDVAVMSALGATGRTAELLTTLAAAAAACTGVAVAVVVAVLASPMMPIGPVRRVEAHPGFDVDGAVFGVGGPALLVVLIGWSWRAARRTVRSVTTPPPRAMARYRRPRLATRANRLPPAAATGIRFAFGGGGGHVSRSALASAITAVAAIAGAVVFAASLSHLVDTPAEFGWNFDAALISGNGYDNFDPATLDSTMRQHGDISAWTGVWFGADSSGGLDVPLLGMSVDSSLRPPLVAGRFLSSAGEIVLGVSTATDLSADVGDDIVLDGTGARRTFRVVGIAVLPTVGKTHVQHTSLGRGAVVVPDAVPGSNVTILGQPSSTTLGPHAVFIRFGAGTATSKVADLAHLRAISAPLGGFAGMDTLGTQRPAELIGSNQVRVAPILLALGLALGASISLVIALAGSLRAHTRELAVLAALGFTRGQQAGAMIFQSLAIVTGGVVVGLPIGIVVGRSTWRLLTDRLGVNAPAVVAWPVLVATIVVATATAIVIAAPPALAARRLDVTRALRGD